MIKNKMLMLFAYFFFIKKKYLARYKLFLSLILLTALIILLILGMGNQIVLSQSKNSLNLKSDFNGDGKSDILWRHFTNGQLSIWQMNGNTRLSAGIFATEADQNWKIVGTGDFNGDGKSDILWRHFTNGAISIWQMNGSTRLSGEVIGTEADQNWKIVGTGDFNSNNDGQITLPFKSGQTWYVCQGYQGSVTHQNLFALDLSVAQDFGSSACYPVDGNNNKSADQQVFAPATGKVVYVNTDLVCLLMDSNRSFLIGHIKRTVPNGATVNQDSLLGTVSQAVDANGNFAHIHVEARNSANCNSGTSVPFTAANGFQFSGVGDLPDLSNRNDYFKSALKKP
jgi:hypothetical protein